MTGGTSSPFAITVSSDGEGAVGIVGCPIYRRRMIPLRGRVGPVNRVAAPGAWARRHVCSLSA
jgi:hypothetical protein